MTLRKWCHCAQEDQLAGINHLYANFGHSWRTGIMPKPAVEAFVKEVDALGGRPLAPAASGVANRAVMDAIKATLISDPPRPDFRFIGKPIPAKTGDVLVNLSVRPIDPSATGTISELSNVNPKQLVWLTTRDAVAGAIKAALKPPATDLSQLDFFRELVHSLGLKANPRFPIDADYKCIVYLARLKADGVLIRPHALSGGYDDRFCGASPLKPFGSTADNRTGKSGLPEAICLAENIDLLDSGPEYDAFRRELLPMAPWIATGATPISATLAGDELFELETRYHPEIHEVILKRLNAPRHDCRTSAAVCVCKDIVAP
jgi:hypothetical protein